MKLARKANKLNFGELDMNKPRHYNNQYFDLGRLIFLIDGVFAVSITLLVLDLKLPDGNTNLASALKQMLPGFFVYLIAFTSIAGYWTIHHRSFHRIARGDSRLMILSFINLLFITLLPLAASIVGAHPLEPLATMCLSVNCMLYCFSSWATWTYAAANPQLLTGDDDIPKLQRIGRIMLAGAICLAAAIPLAFLSVYLAYAIWILFAPVASGWSHRIREPEIQKGNA
jgi:uncharacterized membrane protein